jgi:hypothetical protein
MLVSYTPVRQIPAMYPLMQSKISVPAEPLVLKVRPVRMQRTIYDK